MKKLMNTFYKMLMFLGILFAVSCKPNGNKNSTDTQNDLQETTSDSTRYPGGPDDNKMMTDSSLMRDTLSKKNN